MSRKNLLLVSRAARQSSIVAAIALVVVLAQDSLGQAPAARLPVIEVQAPKLDPPRDPTQPNPELWGLLEGENEQALEAMVRRLTLLKSLRDLMGATNNNNNNINSAPPRVTPGPDPQPVANNAGNVTTLFPTLRVCGRIHGKDANSDSAAIVEVNEKSRMIVRPGLEYPIPGFVDGEPLSMYVVSLHNHHVEVEIRPLKRKMILP